MKRPAPWYGKGASPGRGPGGGLGEGSLPAPSCPEGELSEVLARLEALEEENRALRAALEEQTALLKRLAQALERPRRPWWRFWER